MPESTESAAPRCQHLPWRPGTSCLDLPSTQFVDTDSARSPQLSGAYPLGWLPRSEEDVAASWLNQYTVVRQCGISVRIQARLDTDVHAGVVGDQYTGREDTQWPLTSSILILGAVRGPTVNYPQEAAASRDELIRQLKEFGMRATATWTLDRGHQWAEPSVLASPGPQEGNHDLGWPARALDVARQMGITTSVLVEDGRWDVLSITENDDPRVTVAASATATITQDEEHRCPMHQAPTWGQYCVMRGGPWTSRSMTAAGGWRIHRDMLIESLTCDTCDGVRYILGDKLRIGGGPIQVVQSPMTTRWLEPNERTLDVTGFDPHA